MNTSTATLSPLNIFSSWYSFHIFYPIVAYFLPIGILLDIINNLLVLLIFGSRKNVNRHIKPSIRVYYIATAIGDIIVCFPVLLFYFLGTMQHFSILTPTLNFKLIKERLIICVIYLM